MMDGWARTSKGVEKEFFHVVGVTGVSVSERRQRGRAPMEICRANLGSMPKAGALPGVLGEQNRLFSVLNCCFLFRQCKEENTSLSGF